MTTVSALLSCRVEDQEDRVLKKATLPRISEIIASKEPPLAPYSTIMTTQQQHHQLETPMDERKEDIIHDDVASLTDKSKVPGNDAVPLVTQDKYLSLWQSIRTYPRASALSAAAAFGAVSDGYQFNLPGGSG